MTQQYFPRQGIPLVPHPGARADADSRSLIRAITAKALGAARDQGPIDILQRDWPEDTQARLILRAAVSPTSTSSYLAVTTASVLASLAPASASARLFAKCLKVDLAGVSKVRVPYVVNAPVPGFIGEGSAAPLAQFSLSGVDVGPTKKFLIQTAVTGELESATPETASTMIGKALADATAKSVDAAVFSNVAADAVRPAGLLYNVTPLTAATDSPNVTMLELMATDIANLATAIADANIAVDDMVIVAAVAQAMKLQMLSSRNLLIIGTNALADGTVVGIAPGAVGVGFSGSPEIETSKEATVHFEDTSPLPIATGAQGSGVVAVPTRSAWQTDMIVIKVRARTAWAALPGAIALIENVGW